MNRVVEIWERREIQVRLTWNPCNCHPTDLMKEYDRKFKKAVTYTNQNKSSWTKKMKKEGWKRLSRKITKIK
jgi:hypothetical protein